MKGRVLFHHADLAELQQKHPDCDVRAVASALSNWSQTHPVHAPLKMLETWIARANRRGTYRHAGLLPPSFETRYVGEASSPEYAAFRRQLNTQILAERMSPADVAELLEGHLARYGGPPWHREVLELEISVYRRCATWVEAQLELTRAARLA